MIYYPIPLHKQKALLNYVDSKCNLQNTEMLSKECVSLLIFIIPVSLGNSVEEYK